jgi:hypothetical protein
MNTPIKNTTAAPQHISNDASAREELIAQAAYFRAERRGFQGGDPVQDWLDAEAEIDASMSRGPQLEKPHERRGPEQAHARRAPKRAHEPAAPQQSHERPAPAQTHEYQKEIAAQLKAGAERLEKLRPKLAKLKAETRKELERELVKLEGLRDNLAQKAGDVRRRSEKKGEELKQQAEKLLRDFKAGLERLGSRFDR